jgi:hypothetical protein
MAGSYLHIVGRTGRLLSETNLPKMLENDGDVYEAIEEMYGMIWWLADGNANDVEIARRHYLQGIQKSPGRQNNGRAARG